MITTTGTLLISFAGRGERLTEVAVLAGGVIVLGALAMSKPVDRVLTRLIRRALARWTDLDVRDHAGLLELGGAMRSRSSRSTRTTGSEAARSGS